MDEAKGKAEMGRIEALRHSSLLENSKKQKRFGSRERKEESVLWQASISSHTFRCYQYQSLIGVSGKAGGCLLDASSSYLLF